MTARRKHFEPGLCRRFQRQRGFRGRGFTLFEVLIALGLAGALLASAFSFYFNLLNTRKRLIERADQQRAADVIIDQIEAGLTTCIVRGGKLGAGVRGNNTSLTIVSSAVSASLADRGVDDPVVFSDLQWAQIDFDAKKRTISMQRRSVAGEDAGRNQSQVLTDRIAKLRFRFYDGSQWRDTFDSVSADALPMAVEVAVWFDLPDDERVTDEAGSAAEAVGNSAGDRNFGTGFDEYAYAMRADRGFEQEPLPDRLRVIRVPDAAKDDADGSDNSVSAGGGS